MKVCRRIPLECVNKCGAKDIPREEVRHKGFCPFPWLGNEAIKYTQLFFIPSSRYNNSDQYMNAYAARRRETTEARKYVCIRRLNCSQQCLVLEYF